MAKKRINKQDGPGAPLGNKNSEKWTKASATKLFIDMLKLSEDVQYDYLGIICKELSISRAQVFHLIDRFPELQEIYEVIKDNCGTNCYVNAKGAKNQSIYILNLKSNHKWTDRIETENVNTNNNTITWIEHKTYPEDETTDE